MSQLNPNTATTLPGMSEEMNTLTVENLRDRFGLANTNKPNTDLNTSIENINIKDIHE